MSSLEPKEHVPGQKCGMRIEQLWAYLSIDPNDDCEGVIGFVAPDRNWMPMIASDEKRVKALRPLVDRLIQKEKLKVRLVKFEARVDVEELS
jgi:hypothetical protein